MNFAKAINLSFTYPQADSPALLDLKFNLPKARHIAVLGANGSGKSSLAKLLAALYQPTLGSLEVLGRDLNDPDAADYLRHKLAIVFQNPDNQIVATTVEEDIAFGPENQGIANPLLRQLVDDALELVDLTAYAQSEPTELSGGQKQKLALAGVLVMDPDVLILDEATSMLDPETARALFKFIKELCRQREINLINITHNMEEALEADELLVLKEGKIGYQGSVKDFFVEDNVRSFHLLYPQHLYLWREILRSINSAETPSALTFSEVKEAIIKLLDKQAFSKDAIDACEKYLNSRAEIQRKRSENSPVIEVKDLYFSYRPDLPISIDTLRGIDFDLRQGEILAVLGPSGAGKSTLMLHLNALLKLQRGEIKVLGERLGKQTSLKNLRRKVGLVFQYPENQLFAETVYNDIAFGPRQMGLSEAEVKRRVLEASSLVSIDESFMERSPFELSGGEMRRVAIAGVVAMGTEIIVMDEPSAGLDPEGSREIVRLLKKLRELGKSLILVSHDMEDVAEVADRALLLEAGQVLGFSSARELFNQPELLSRAMLSSTPPQEIIQAINETYSLDFKVQTTGEAIDIIKILLGAQ
ncbi:MAG: energy-coupling factor transporter ATPase [Eubacteriales bacterium]|nr:energy-coupling factor transporter ATPase [Eubacteriales bacterium]